MNLLKKYNILNIGTFGLKDAQEKNRIRLTNTIAVVPLTIFIFSTIYSIIGDYYRIVQVNTISILCTIIVLILNSKHKYVFAKSLLLCSHAFTILIYYKLMEDEPSMFFYYFVVILSFIIFYNPTKEKYVILFTSLFVLTCIILTLTLPNQLFNPFPLPSSLHRFIYFFNAIICSCLATLFLYRIFIVNILNERSLVKSKIAAEKAAEAKTVFLSNMSHELRTPLNGIIGTSHILKNEKHLPNQEEHISILTNLSEHMLGLVNNILDFSKIDAGKLEMNNYHFNLNDYLSKIYLTFKFLFEEKGIAYHIEMDEAIGNTNVISDGLRLQQVLNNLLSNALKFTNKNGTVTLKISVLNKLDSTINLLFSVTDTGIGISNQHITEIFESFKQGDSATTRKYGGSGLGLAISKSLIEQFGGTLQVESELGKGSIFFFNIDFPISQQNEKIIDNKNIPIVNNLENKTILLVEDNKINMMVARNILQKWGMKITEAENGEIAYKKCIEQDFDIILLDLEMPIMDGKTAAKKINDLRKQIPIIAFTAGVYDDMKNDLLNAGFSDYLHKPFVSEELYRKIISKINNKEFN